MLCEVTLQSQKGYVIVIYPSPNQSVAEFDEFLSNFEILIKFVKGLNHPLLLYWEILMQDLNHGGQMT